VLGIALFYVIGFSGLAAATAFASWLNVGQMAWTLRRRGDWTPSRAAWGKLLRILIASAALGGALYLAGHQRGPLEAWLGAARLWAIGPKEIAVLAVCLAGAAIYPVLLLGSGGVTPGEVKAALRRRPRPAP